MMQRPSGWRATVGAVLLFALACARAERSLLVATTDGKQTTVAWSGPTAWSASPDLPLNAPPLVGWVSAASACSLCLQSSHR